MASGNSTQSRAAGVPSPLGNAGAAAAAAATNQLSHLRPPSLVQGHQGQVSSSPFHGLFQSPPQGQPQMQSPFQIQMGSSPSFSTPGSSGAPKRPPQKPPSRPLVPAPAAANPTTFKTADLTPTAKRKKQKLPEKKLPDRVAALLPESSLYTQLLEFGARVDAALARKKIDIQEALKNPPSMQRTLRIYVFNTFANQMHAVPAPKNAEPPSWSLKIIGRILEDGGDTNPAGGGILKPNQMYPKFSSFFKRVTITLDPALYPENPMIIWESARSSGPHEGFEVKRKGDKEFTANIRLEMYFNPEKFRLSPPLMEVLGIEVDTRARVIAGLWQYVKAKKLQNPSDPSYFTCDLPLRKVFGEDKMRFAMISQKISQHLSPPLPINVEHRVRLSGNGAVGSASYDVLVDLPFPLHREMAAFLASMEKHKDIEACDEVICASINKIHEHRRRRAFFLGFSQSPVEFINALIASQSRDLKLLSGEASLNAERERRADFYNQPWVEDAVLRFLNRKPASGNDAPSSM